MIPCFILDPRQVESKNNEYKSNNALQFMVESLRDLDRQFSLLKHNDQIRLHLFYGEQERVVKQLISSEKIDAVNSNKYYTSFSKNEIVVLNKFVIKAMLRFINMQILYSMNQNLS
jgi:deoxyribodipyrimidine photolyase